jgi:DNA-directed RNA polymerase sigma subunit (sigma70/sigma32)
LSFKKEYYKISKRLGRRPTEEELAKMLGLTEKKVKVLLSVPTDIISLDMKLSREENSADLSSILPDESMDDPQAALIGVSTRDLIVQDIDELSEREARVIRMRYGFKDQRPMRLREIAKEMNMSPEGIRRIEMKALKKLKNKLNRQGVYGVLN